MPEVPTRTYESYTEAEALPCAGANEAALHDAADALGIGGDRCEPIGSRRPQGLPQSPVHRG